MKELEVLAGGRSLPAKFKDGQTSDVFVRELPIRLMPNLAAVLNEEEKLAELFCARPEGWADTLTRETVMAIVTTGEDLNLPFFKGWLQRRIARNVLIAGQLAGEAPSQPPQPPTASANSAPNSASSVG